MSDETVLYEPDAGGEAFVTVTLNRPEKLNAINSRLALELDDAIRRACADEGVAAIVLTGAGRAFSAGYDLEAENFEMDSEGWRENIATACRQMFAIWSAPKPIVAAVNGYALAGGLELMMCCDLAIAAEDAQLGEPEIRHASAPPTLMLPWLVPIRHARYLMYTGDMIDGVEAARMGLVNRAVPAERVMPEARRLATKLARMPKPGIKFTKAALNQAQMLAGLYASWMHNMETTAQLHATENGRAWMRLLFEKPLKEFLEIREAPFREPDEGGGG
ncbi:MAG TPA: enoyl-CoA hydratase/isomerase family protein [Geminicoccaceae bacterium]|nr:enoyl-CoA hydratase/isomerase family protein [Geminicoccaceae bacterium]